jgi:hypothetical protein
MALISGSWSLWAPSFGADAVDYERLRKQQIAIGDIVLSLFNFTKEELAGNYTKLQQERAAGATQGTLNFESEQFIVNGTVAFS